MYDLVIVGGGPAGATLARLIGKNMRTLVLDKRQLDSRTDMAHEKCCGGLLAPDAQEMLARFGLGVPKEVLVGPQLFTVRTIDYASVKERYYPRNYINVDREAFDRWLISLIPHQVETVWAARYKGHNLCTQGIEVKYTTQGRQVIAKARMLVGADGAFSRVRAELGVAVNPKLYTCVQEWFLVKKAQPYYSAIFDPDVTDFYAWTIPKEDMLLVGAAIPAEEEVARRFLHFKETLVKDGYDLGRSIKKRGAYLLRPSRLNQINLGRENIALIGEAAGWISPSSAEGLSYAFRSALALALALKDGTDDAIIRYSRLTRSLRLNILGKIMKSPAMYRPFLRRLSMGSGLLSMKIVR